MNVLAGAVPQSGQRGADVQNQGTGALVNSTDQQRKIGLLLAALLGTMVIHFSTYRSMIEIWLRSDTFLHCIVIFPVSAFLVWQRWPLLRKVDAHLYFPGFVAVLGASVAWWLADFLGIQFAKQLIVVAMLSLVLLALAGPEFVRAIAFPLGYLLFAVPFGTAAIPHLVDFTAFFTVEALQITGIPVVREGAYFSIPSGHFEVARACSGIRYLLASMALGALFSYVMFQRIWKRLAFFAFSLLLPIVANGIRAFGIVLLAHYSEMRLAVGVDHLIYGWLFFGVVILVMFWVGSYFKDRPASESIECAAPVEWWGANSSRSSVSIPSTVLMLFIVAAGPAAAFGVSRMEFGGTQGLLPAAADDWRVVPTLHQDWQPDYSGATHAEQRSYASNGQRVDLAVFRYGTQKQGSELANEENSVAERGRWWVTHAEMRQLEIASFQSLPIKETFIRDHAEVRLVWSWHEVNGKPVVGDLETKMQELLSVLRLRIPVSAAVLVSVPVADTPESARSTMLSFLNASLQSIKDCLYGHAESASVCLSESGDDTNAEQTERTAAGEA